MPQSCAVGCGNRAKERARETYTTRFIDSLPMKRGHPP